MLLGQAPSSTSSFNSSQPGQRRRSLLRRLFKGEADQEAQASFFEQRGLARIPVQTAATMTELDHRGLPGRSWPIDLIDLSKGGAAISTGIFVAPGTPVMIQLPSADGEPPRHLIATVMHIRRLNAIDFAAGVQFGTRGLRAADVFGIR